MRLKIGSGEQGAEMLLPEFLKSDTVKIVGIPKQSNPAGIDAVMQAFENGEKTINLNVKFGYIHLRSSIALIRAAYLFMFRKFGYTYIFDSSAKPILHQIRNLHLQTPVLRGIMWRMNEPLPVENSVYVLTKSEYSGSFIVFLRLHASTKHVAGVVLPAPGTDGVALYDSFQSLDARGTRSLTCSPLPNEAFGQLGLRSSRPIQ